MFFTFLPRSFLRISTYSSCKGGEIPTGRDYHPCLHKNTFFSPMKHKTPRIFGIFCRILKKHQFRNYLDFFFPLQRIFFFLSYKLPAFQKYKGNAGSSDCGSPTGVFSRDDHKKANNSTETSSFLAEIHIRMMNWQNMKETNPVPPTALGEFQTIPGRGKSVLLVPHPEFIFATSVFHSTGRLKSCLSPFITNTSSTWAELCSYYLNSHF